MTATIDRAAWLAGLKPGDEVAIRTGMTGYPSIHRVEKITATGIIKIGRCSWNSRGESRGDGYNPDLEPVTQEVHDEIELQSMRNWIGAVKWRPVSLSKLRRIKAILEETDE